MSPQLTKLLPAEQWIREMSEKLGSECVVVQDVLGQVALEREQWRQGVFQRRIRDCEPGFLAISRFMQEELKDGRMPHQDMAYSHWMCELTSNAIADSLQTIEEERAFLRAAAERSDLEPVCQEALVAAGEECIRDGIAAMTACLIPAPRIDLHRALPAAGVPSGVIDADSWQEYGNVRLGQLADTLRGYRESSHADNELAYVATLAAGRFGDELSSAEREAIQAALGRCAAIRRRGCRARQRLWQSEWDQFVRARSNWSEVERTSAAHSVAPIFMPTIYPCPFLESGGDDSGLAAESVAALSEYRGLIALLLEAAEGLVARHTTCSFARVTFDPAERTQASYLRSMRDIRKRACEALLTLIAEVPESDRSTMLARIPAIELASGEWPDLKFVDNPEWPSLYPQQREEWLWRAE